MFKTSAASVAKTEKALDRSFAPAILAKARQLAPRYQIVLRFEAGEYYGRCLEMPGATDNGRTPDECVQATREAIISLLAYLLEAREPVPAPAGESRTEQINVRLTPAEKLQLETTAQRKGFRGISELVRSAALAIM